VIGIAQQRKRKSLLLSEFTILLDRIEAAAEDLDVFRFVVFDEVAEPATFGGSTGCVGFWKEPQHDFLSSIVAQLDTTAAMIGHVEIGSGIADFQHRWASSEKMADDSAD